MINLDYLKNITIWKDGMAAPIVYGSKNWCGLFMPKEAIHEGLCCVDDAARAAILMMDDGNPANEVFVRGYLNFLEYMILPDGPVNFITDTEFSRSEEGRTSYPGGQWWSVRMRYAFARAYRYYPLQGFTDISPYSKNDIAKVLKRYRDHCFILDELFETFESEKIKALYILSQVQLERADRHMYTHTNLRYPILQFKDGAFVNDDNKPWGYHQLQAAVAFDEHVANIYADQIRSTVDTYIKDLTFDTDDDVCAYSFSSIIQGLSGHPVLQKEMIEKFHRIFNVQPDGSCNDGMENYDRGAESCCEAGFIRLCEKRLEERAEYYISESYT